MTLPVEGHPLGTDELGRDLLLRILWGGRTSITIALAATVVSSVLGIILGLAGAAAGAFLAVSLESEILKKLFGGFLLLMGLSEIFKKKKGEDTHAKR